METQLVFEPNSFFFLCKVYVRNAAAVPYTLVQHPQTHAAALVHTLMGYSSATRAAVAMHLLTCFLEFILVPHPPQTCKCEDGSWPLRLRWLTGAVVAQSLLRRRLK